jgi:hypothetical protein
VAALATKPVWITESGSRGAASHREWMTASFDRIRGAIPNVERIFWFDLFDTGEEGFRLIDIAPTLEGGFEVVPESSDALDFLHSRTDETLAGLPAIPYRDLVPDIMLYFPTEEDFEILANTSFGREIWRS